MRAVDQLQLAQPTESLFHLVLTFHSDFVHLLRSHRTSESGAVLLPLLRRGQIVDKVSV